MTKCRAGLTTGQGRSPKKKVSHTKLLVEEVKDDGLVSLYKKKELKMLCTAYGVAFQSRWNKRELAT